MEKEVELSLACSFLKIFRPKNFDTMPNSSYLT